MFYKKRIKANEDKIKDLEKLVKALILKNAEFKVGDLITEKRIKSIREVDYYIKPDGVLEYFYKTPGSTYWEEDLKKTKVERSHKHVNRKTK